MRKVFLIIIGILLSTVLAVAQPFSLQLDSLPSLSIMQGLVINESDDILLLMLQFNYPPLNDGTDYHIIPITGQPGDVASMKISFPIHHQLGFVIDAFYHSDKLIMLTNPVGVSLLTHINLTSGDRWTKKLYSGRSRSIVTGNGSSIVFNAIHPPPFGDYSVGRIIEVFKFDTDGNLLWKKGLVLNKPEIIGIGKHLFPVRAATDSDNNIYLSGRLFDNDSIGAAQTQFLIKMDSLGNAIKWRSIKVEDFNELYVSDDGVYLLDKTSFMPYSNNNALDKTLTKLVKLDHDFNFQWGKTYQGDGFNYLASSIQQKPDGTLVMSHSTFGAFPVVLTQLDQMGNILSQKGYPNYEPQIVVMADGALLLGTLSEEGAIAQVPVIAKTDTDGNIAGCFTLPTCLYAEDFSIEMDSFEIGYIEPFEPEESPSVLETTTASFTPYCDYPPAPVPDFAFPDTLCLGDSATTLSLGNRLAQAREWQLTGPGTDTLLRDSFEFGYRFMQPGSYLLRQTVWVLGCDYSYERPVTVLPPLTVAIAADANICPGEPTEITATANRPASYQWGSPAGATGPSITVPASGTYTVTATDGHCEATDSATVKLVSELLGNAPPFTLPRDTTTCQPFELVPQSQFADAFYLDADTVAAASFLLSEAGGYRISMEAFGCRFTELYNYGRDCQVDVYVPNSFSPNGDGINDEFGPYGFGFELLELSIYDRWGGLRHRGQAWDGGKAGQGVYLYKMSYTNLRSGLREERNGEVLLVK